MFRNAMLKIPCSVKNSQKKKRYKGREICTIKNKNTSWDTLTG